MWLLAKTSEHFPKFFFIAVDRELLFFFLKAHSFGKLTLKSAFTFYDIVRSHHHVNSTCKVGRNLHFLNCHSLVAESPHNYVSNKGLEVMQDSNHKIIIPPIYAELYLQNIFMHIVSSGTQVHLVRWLPLSPQKRELRFREVEAQRTSTIIKTELGLHARILRSDTVFLPHGLALQHQENKLCKRFCDWFILSCLLEEVAVRFEDSRFSSLLVNCVIPGRPLLSVHPFSQLQKEGLKDSYSSPQSETVLTRTCDWPEYSISLLGLLPMIFLHAVRGTAFSLYCGMRSSSALQWQPVKLFT